MWFALLQESYSINASVVFELYSSAVLHYVHNGELLQDVRREELLHVAILVGGVSHNEH